MESEVDTELLSILQNESIILDARLKGWQYVLGLTASEDGFHHVIVSTKYIPFILSCIQQKKSEKDVLRFAYKCLINISKNRDGAFAIMFHKNAFIEQILNAISSQEYDFIEPKCYIISNLSAQPEFAKEIIDIFASSQDLLDKILNSFNSLDSGIRKKYDFLTLVLANVSQHTEGRRFLFQKENFIDAMFTCINRSQSNVRRLGAALIIRNCCLEIENHEKLLGHLNVLPVLLMPLMGSEEYAEHEMDKLPIECQLLEDSKEQDQNPLVRRILIQALILICYSEKGWNHLKSKGAYFVARELHKWEQDPTVKEAIETFVTYMLVEKYVSPTANANELAMEPILIKEFEADMARDLPDFVI